MKSSPHCAKEQTNVLQAGVVHWHFQKDLELTGDDLDVRPRFHEMTLAAFKMGEMIYYLHIEANADLLVRR